jgi:hypothetical protein
MSSADLEIIDGAVPLVRNDEPWEWFVFFWEDQAETTPTDLTGLVPSAEIRWQDGAQTVLAEIVDPPTGGQVKLSLAAAETAGMPLGRLSRLYLAIGTDTEAVVPVNVLEGLVP